MPEYTFGIYRRNTVTLYDNDEQEIIRHIAQTSTLEEAQRMADELNGALQLGAYDQLSRLAVRLREASHAFDQRTIAHIADVMGVEL